MTQTCENCGDEFEAEYPHDLCGDCAEKKAEEALGKIEPPEGGWPRGSDMDRI